MAILGYKKTTEREAIRQENLVNNQKLELKKGNILRLTYLKDAHLDYEFIYDEVEEVEVTAIRKSNKGLRVAIKNIKFGYGATIILSGYNGKIEILS